MDTLLATTMRTRLRNQKINVIAAIHYPNSGQPQDNNTISAKNAVYNFKHFGRMLLVCQYLLVNEKNIYSLCPLCFCGEDEPGFELVERLLAEEAEMKVRINDAPLQIQEILIKGYRSMTIYTFFSVLNKIVKWW